METLEKIVPIPARRDIAGERMDITPIKTRELPAMMRAIKPIAAKVQSEDIMGAFLDNPDALIEAVAIGARKSREWVDALDLDDLVALAGDVLEVNGDFFIRAVLPGVTEAINRMTALAGPKQ